MIKTYNDCKDFLDSEQQKDYYKELKQFLVKEYETGNVYPPADSIFKAFEITPFSSVKVVIIGQDVYHTPNTAMGLAFSVKPECRIPPSLQNIYKEIDNEYGSHSLKNGDLTPWAEQGVFLLNTILTVYSGCPGSHAGKGWEIFTDNVISLLNDDDKPKVFLLWGKFAQRKSELITNKLHFVLESAHPSPFSARNGFFGNNHFLKTNEFLRKNVYEEIVW